ncbi:alkaline phosphatase family protein [Candidatus Harpocratesius sp.]
MLFPEYNGGSIVNLMASLGQYFGISMEYSPLEKFPTGFLNSNNSSPVILIIIDGLGYNYLIKHCRKSNFHKYLAGKMTSVFPSTTAAAMTTFYSGIAPINHGIPAWFTYLREIGVVSTILPMHVRSLKASILYNNLTASDIFQFPSFAARLSQKSATLFPKSIYKSPYSSYAVKGSIELKYPIKNLRAFFKTIRKTMTHKNPPSYMLAYWPDFDTSSHIYGIESNQTMEHFNALDREFGYFIDEMKTKGRNMKIIITADHGLIDTTEEHSLWLHDYPELRHMLTLPIVGEGRVPFLYVRPKSVQAFERYMENHFGEVGELWTGEQTFNHNLFGLYQAHPQFTDRIGDYLLFMKDNYVFRERLLGEKREKMIGHHGGLSPEEMEVPLILVDI